MSSISRPEQPLDLLQNLIERARACGADAADAMYIESAALSTGWRDGHIETMERAESANLGLRVLIGKKQSLVATTSLHPDALAPLVERAVAMAKASPEDPFCGLADKNEIAKNFVPLELADDFAVTPDMLLALAREGEEAARAVPGVTRTEGADASASQSRLIFAASNGFIGTNLRTSYGLSVSALAGDGTGMEQGGDYASRIFWSDMPSAAAIGRRAGERAVKHLNPRKAPTCQVPVVFEPREAAGFLSILSGAISGSAIARKTSFLQDYLGEKVFGDAIQVIDDPFMPRGLRSKSFDGEGIAPCKRAIVENGTLTTWLMDLRSARQLGMKSTGHASRGTASLPSPSPTNLYMAPGNLSPDELIRDIKSGLYVTSQMGDGVNDVTGDYSLAAMGFWIENGEIAYPVNEITIAGNLRQMYLNTTPANDLKFEDGLNTPTLRIEGMTVAGK